MKKCLVYGVGINDADYRVQENKCYTNNLGKRATEVLWRCPYYDRWYGMIRRCYSERELSRFPTYKGCSVCEEWLTFSNFKSWMEQQDWEGKHLDKDLLIYKNKVYSSETCVFVDYKVNLFIIKGSTSKSNLFVNPSIVFALNILSGDSIVVPRYTFSGNTNS